MVTAITNAISSSVEQKPYSVAGVASSASSLSAGSSGAAQMSAASVQAALRTADTILTNAQKQASAYNALLDQKHAALANLDKSGDMRFQKEYDTVWAKLEAFQFDRWDAQLADADFSSPPVYGVGETGHVQVVVSSVSGVFNGVERTVTKSPPATSPAATKVMSPAINLEGLPESAKSAVKAAETIITNAQRQADQYNNLVDKAAGVLKLAQSGDPRALTDYPAIRSQLDTFKFDQFDKQLAAVGFSSLPPFGGNGAGYVKMIIDTATGEFDGVKVQLNFDGTTGRFSVGAKSTPRPESPPASPVFQPAAQTAASGSKMSAEEVRAALQTADTLLTNAQKQASAYNSLLDQKHAALANLEKSGDMRFQQEYDTVWAQLDAFQFDRWDLQLADAGFSSPPVFGVDETGHVQVAVKSVSGVFNGVKRTVTKTAPPPKPATTTAEPPPNLGGLPKSAKDAVKAAGGIITNAQKQADQYNNLVDKSAAVLKLAQSGDPGALAGYPAVRSQVDTFNFDQFDQQLAAVGFSTQGSFGSNGAGYVKMTIDTANGEFDGVAVQLNFDSTTGRFSVKADFPQMVQTSPETQSASNASTEPVQTKPEANKPQVSATASTNVRASVHGTDDKADLAWLRDQGDFWRNLKPGLLAEDTTKLAASFLAELKAVRVDPKYAGATYEENLQHIALYETIAKNRNAFTDSSFTITTFFTTVIESTDGSPKVDMHGVQGRAPRPNSSAYGQTAASVQRPLTADSSESQAARKWLLQHDDFQRNLKSDASSADVDEVTSFFLKTLKSLQDSLKSSVAAHGDNHRHLAFQETVLKQRAYFKADSFSVAASFTSILKSTTDIEDARRDGSARKQEHAMWHVTAAQSASFSVDIHV